MIRGTFLETTARRRPVINAPVAIPSQNLLSRITFLVDTGADPTLLSPRDALRLGLNLELLQSGPSTAGVGGVTRTVVVDATITLGPVVYPLSLRVLAPEGPQQRALNRIPSLLGRDLLAHFALFMEERTNRVFLLDPNEADALSLA